MKWAFARLHGLFTPRTGFVWRIPQPDLFELRAVIALAVDVTGQVHVHGEDPEAAAIALSTPAAAEQISKTFLAKRDSIRPRAPPDPP
jgi:hypothetical protein